MGYTYGKADMNADKDHKPHHGKCKIVTVGEDWCGYTRLQVSQLKEHSEKPGSRVEHDYVKAAQISDPEVSSSLRAFPTSFCCEVGQDSVECAIQQHKKNKSYVGMRSPDDLEKICQTERGNSAN